MFTKIFSVPKSEIVFCQDLLQKITKAVNAEPSQLSKVRRSPRLSEKKARLHRQLVGVTRLYASAYGAADLKKMPDSKIFNTACSMNLVRVVKIMLTLGFDPNQHIETPAGGTTPLIAAIRSYADAVVQALLVFPKIEITLPDDHNNVPLCEAIVCENDFAFHALVKKSCPVGQYDNTGKTPLILAIETGRADYVKVLLRKKASPNQPCSNGVLPLFYAINEGRPDIVKMLIKRGSVIPIDRSHTFTDYEDFLGELLGAMQVLP